MPKKTHFLRKKYLDFLIELIFIFAPTKKESTYVGTRQQNVKQENKGKSLKKYQIETYVNLELPHHVDS